MMINKETREQRNAQLLDEAIERLSQLRNEIAPSDAPEKIPLEEPQGCLSRLCSFVSFCVEVICVYGLFFAAIAFGGLFVWCLMSALIDRLI